MTETLSDGQQYTVQYFERARFELHPENEPAFRVLLGLLGREIHTAAQTAPSPEATAPPQATAPPEATATMPPPLEATPTGMPVPDAGTPNNEICRFPAVVSEAPNFPVRIATVDKVEEIVTLHNVSNEQVDLTGWTMCSVRGNQVHTGIGGFLLPGEMTAFSYTGDGKIWNNSEADDGLLYDNDGKLISYWDDPTDN